MNRGLDGPCFTSSSSTSLLSTGGQFAGTDVFSSVIGVKKCRSSSPQKMKTPRLAEKSDLSGVEMTVSNKMHANHVTFQRTFKVTYLGYAVLDRRYTLPMLPWVIAEIKRFGSRNAEDIYLEVTETSLKAASSGNSHFVFEHKLQSISKFAQTAQDPACFTYMTREVADGPCAYHVFHAIDDSTVLELFTTMREMTKEMINQQSLGSSLLKSGSNPAQDSIISSSQHYEVMYLGKIKVSNKRAPPSFIDDAVEKFRIYEIEKVKCQSGISRTRQRHSSGSSVTSLPQSLDVLEHVKTNQLESQMIKTKLDSKDNLCGGSSENGLENGVSRFTEPVNKIYRGVSPDSFLMSPLSPLGSCEILNHNIHSSHSLVTHTQSMTSSDVNRLMQDFKVFSSKNSLIPPSSLLTHTQSLDSHACEDIANDLCYLHSDNSFRDRVRSVSGDSSTKQNSMSAYQSRVGSGDSTNMMRPRAYTNPSTSSNRQRNRTMLFVIGRLEICLISTDRKQMLLRKTFNDIAHCSQGLKHLDHFGFICRETSQVGSDCYAGYVFRCQDEKVVDEMMQCLKQAFHQAHQEYQNQVHQKTSQVPKVITCEGCPMQWFHKLCVEVEGLSAGKAHHTLQQRLNLLYDGDREEIMHKYQTIKVSNMQEQNEVFMMLLREFCEQKQMKHNHILNGNGNNKSDFGFLKERSSSSRLDSFREKAKKSLSNSFETILRLKGKDDSRERSMTSISDYTIPYTLFESVDGDSKENDPFDHPTHREGSYDGVDSSVGGRVSPFLHRPRSSTFSTAQEVRKEKIRRSAKEQDKKDTQQPKSPIMNIFIKVGHQTKTPSTSGDEVETPSKRGSWRQAIFHRVQTPVHQNKHLNGEMNEKANDCDYTSDDGSTLQLPRSKEELRALWKKAILEQILLIRMEKENKKLQVSQDAVSSKRMKLDYEEISPCLKSAIQKWDELLNNPRRPELFTTTEELQDLVKSGIPRHRRGEIWQFLAEQHIHHCPTKVMNFDIDLEVPYEELLKQLTSHQHAIIIDLGRTFPKHPFFAQPLGSGQLSLYNLLKAYSLLDNEVGYCQGLSFVAGILLLHMPEERAFLMMKHILFNLGLRRQYKPDMVALQVQMYQLSRLMHDNYRDVYDHLEKNDIAPTLYAAPWFLTLFASQFPLGFVSRLFDMIFLHGLDVVLKVALVLMGNHHDHILQCHGFEPIMDFLKMSLPSIGIIQMERLFNQVFNLDVSKQLHAYEVEYHVLQEEMMYSPSKKDLELVRKLETANRNLKVQNMELMEQLQVAYSTVHHLEASEASYKSTVQRLEARVAALEDEKDCLLHSIRIMKARLEKLEVSHLESDSDLSRESVTPSLGVVYALAGSEKDEDMQFRQFIKDFCDKRGRMSDEGDSKLGESDVPVIDITDPGDEVGDTELLGDDRRDNSPYFKDCRSDLFSHMK